MIRPNWMDSIFAPLRINLSPGRAFDTIMVWIERTQQRRALARLDDRLLADIGRSRADVALECDKSFWRE